MVDSYNPPHYETIEKKENGKVVSEKVFVEGEIVSRKHTQLAEVTLGTALWDVSETKKKYAPGTEILDILFNPNALKGQKLKGNLYLDVPIQNSTIPEEVLAKAKEEGVIIRQVEDLPKSDQENNKSESCSK